MDCYNRIVELKEVTRKIDEGNCPLCLWKEYVNIVELPRKKKMQDRIPEQNIVGHEWRCSLQENTELEKCIMCQKFRQTLRKGKKNLLNNEEKIKYG